MGTSKTNPDVTEAPRVRLRRRPGRMLGNADEPSATKSAPGPATGQKQVLHSEHEPGVVGVAPRAVALEANGREGQNPNSAENGSQEVDAAMQSTLRN